VHLVRGDAEVGVHDVVETLVAEERRVGEGAHAAVAREMIVDHQPLADTFAIVTWVLIINISLMTMITIITGLVRDLGVKWWDLPRMLMASGATGMSSKWLPTKWKDLMSLDAVSCNCSMASILLFSKLSRPMWLMLVNTSLRMVPRSDSWMLNSCSLVTRTYGCITRFFP